MSKTLEKLRTIKLKRHCEPYRPTRKPEDIEKLLEINQGLQTTRASKNLNAILLKFAFWTGLRVSEICDLKLENVFLDEGKILVLHGKGGRSRWVAIHPELKTDLERYIYEQRQKYESTLFVLPDGRCVTRDRLEKRMKLLCNKAGFDGGWHQLRRGCFTNYANRGAPLHMLQMIAGHSDIKTTMKYIRPDVDEVLGRQRQW